MLSISIAFEVDLVVVLPHWGNCDYTFPQPEQLDLANRLLAAGADAVVGHHSHVVHGLVVRGDRLIAYSLGNFSFAPFSYPGRAAEFSKDNREGVVLKVSVAGGGVSSHEVVYSVEKNGRIDVDESTARAKVLAERSAPLAAPNYDNHWKRFIRRRMFKRILYWGNVRNWRKIRMQTVGAGWVMVREMLLRRGR